MPTLTPAEIDALPSAMRAEYLAAVAAPTPGAPPAPPTVPPTEPTSTEPPQPAPAAPAPDTTPPPPTPRPDEPPPAPAPTDNEVERLRREMARKDGTYGANLQKLNGQNAQLQTQLEQLQAELEALKNPAPPAAAAPEAPQLPTTREECVALWGEDFVKEYGWEFLVKFMTGQAKLTGAAPAALPQRAVDEAVERKLQEQRARDYQVEQARKFWSKVDELSPAAKSLNDNRASNGFLDYLKAVMPGTNVTRYEYMKTLIAMGDVLGVAKLHNDFAQAAGAGPTSAPPPAEAFATPGQAPGERRPIGENTISEKAYKNWMTWAANNRDKVTQREIDAQIAAFDEAARLGRVTP